MIFGPDDLAYLDANTVLVQPQDVLPSEYVYVLQKGATLVGVAVRTKEKADAWTDSGPDRSYTRIAIKHLVE